MKTMNHSKVPWRNGRKPYVNPKDPVFYQADILSGGLRVAVTCGIGTEQCEANRDLIINAVNSHAELLEALENLVKNSALGMGTRWLEACERATSVIAQCKPK